MTVTHVYSPWDGAELPPWIDPPWFDECHYADRLQDMELADEVADERFGPLDELAAEVHRRPTPMPRRFLPPLDPDALRAALTDDAVSCARRRQVLDDLPDERGATAASIANRYRPGHRAA